MLADALGRAVALLDQLLSDRFSDETSLRLMQHAATLDLRDFEDSETQDKLDRARRQASGRSGLVSLLLGQAQDLVTLAGFAAGIAAYAPWLILLLAAALVPAFIGEVRFNRLAYAINVKRTADRRELDYLRQTGASTSTAKEVKLFGLHGFLIGRYRELAVAMQRENAAFALAPGRVGRGVGGAGDGGLLRGLCLPGLARGRGRADGGRPDLPGGVVPAAARAAGGRAGRAVVAGQPGAVSAGSVLVPGRARRHRLAARRRWRSRPPWPAGSSSRMSASATRTRQAWAMRHLSFRLEAGRVLALVGENGAGKTTLVKLLTRLYDPDEGRILVDGHDLRAYDLDSLRAGIGVIFQDFVRYDLSASDNIAVGRIGQRADRGKIEQAAASGRADEVIGRLPAGYDQMVGRRFRGGVELSGGEWQKVALARAYMRDAAVLILDEPTAALDARAEFEVFERFKALSAGRTAVLISHRFSSVRMADQILVVAGGRVEASGTHAELVAQGGRYAELFELQAAGYR